MLGDQRRVMALPPPPPPPSDELDRPYVGGGGGGAPPRTPLLPFPCLRLTAKHSALAPSVPRGLKLKNFREEGGIPANPPPSPSDPPSPPLYYSPAPPA